MAREKIIEGLSSKENVSEQHEWTKKQVETELSSVKMNIIGFYEPDSQNADKIKYDLEAVKSYLGKLYEEIKTKNGREAWNYLSQGTRQYAWIMAVQIALESLGEGWDTELNKIDGLLGKAGSRTRNAVKKFQEKYNETYSGKLSTDGLPGKETIRAILEVLGGSREVSVEDGEEKPESSEIQIKDEIELSEGEVKAEELVELPQGATAEFEDGKGIDKTKSGEQEVVVIVKVGDKVEKITVIVIVDVENKKIQIERREENKPRNKEIEVGEEVRPEDLVELPEGATAEFENGKGVDTTKAKKGVEVVVIVKAPGKEPVRVVVIVDITDKAGESDKPENGEGNSDKGSEEREKLSRNLYGEFDWKYLNGVERGATKIINSVEELNDFLQISDGSKLNDFLKKHDEEFFKTKSLGFKYIVRPNTASERYIIKSVERVGNQVNVIYGDDGVDRGRYGGQVITSEILFVEIDKGDNVNWLEEKDVGGKVIDLPENGEVKPEDLVNMPRGGKAEFKNGNGIDKTKSGEQEVVVIVKAGGKVDEIKVTVRVDVKNGTLVIVKVDVENKEDEGKKQKDNKDTKKGGVESEGMELIEDDRTYANGFRYKGTVDKDGKRQGKGVLKSPDKGLKTDWEYDGYFENDEMHGKGTYKWNYGKNTFNGEREHGRIVVCESFGERINIKYDSKGGYLETKSGKKLYLSKNLEGQTASIVNKIIASVRESNGRLNRFRTGAVILNNHENLVADYGGGKGDITMLSLANYKIGIPAKNLADWLNEYRNDVGI